MAKCLSRAGIEPADRHAEGSYRLVLQAVKAPPHLRHQQQHSLSHKLDTQSEAYLRAFSLILPPISILSPTLRAQGMLAVNTGILTKYSLLNIYKCLPQSALSQAQMCIWTFWTTNLYITLFLSEVMWMLREFLWLYVDICQDDAKSAFLIILSFCLFFCSLLLWRIGSKVRVFILQCYIRPSFHSSQIQHAE